MTTLSRSRATRKTAPRLALRLVAGVGSAGLLVLASAGIASAHVHVDATATAAEGFSQLTFRVPTESETASTTQVSVLLPQEAPFTSVAVQSLAGWTAKVTTAKLPAPVTVGGAELTEAPRTITWKANSRADAVAPEQFQNFVVSVGPLPKAGTALLFPAIQTYSDGKVVKWDQVTPAGGDEPEHPAPSVTTTAAAAGGHDDDDDGDEVMAASMTMPAATDASDSTARWLGGAGLALGVLALGTTLVLGAVRGRSSSPAEPGGRPGQKA